MGFLGLHSHAHCLSKMLSCNQLIAPDGKKSFTICDLERQAKYVMNYPWWRRNPPINNIIHPHVFIVQPSAIPTFKQGFNCKQAQRVLNVDIARCLFLCVVQLKTNQHQNMCIWISRQVSLVSTTNAKNLFDHCAKFQVDSTNWWFRLLFFNKNTKTQQVPPGLAIS